MLIPISNTPRDYSWGSTDLIARLQGRWAASEIITTRVDSLRVQLLSAV